MKKQGTNKAKSRSKFIFTVKGNSETISNTYVHTSQATWRFKGAGTVLASGAFEPPAHDWPIASLAACIPTGKRSPTFPATKCWTQIFWPNFVWTTNWLVPVEPRVMAVTKMTDVLRSEDLRTIVPNGLCLSTFEEQEVRLTYVVEKINCIQLSMIRLRT